MRSFRALAVTAAAGAVAFALTGCADPTDSPTAVPGDSVATVTASGRIGTAPEVEFPVPLSPDDTQCSELIVGEGASVQPNDMVLLGFSAYSGATGQEVQSLGFGEGEDRVPIYVGSSTLPGLVKGLDCGHEGSRVAIVIPPKDAWGDQGNASIGMTGQDSLVVVADIDRVLPSRADGRTTLTRDGFPAVVLAPNGRPGITVPKGDPPASDSVEVETLKQGDGAVVADGDTVLVQYTGVAWSDNTAFDSTWYSESDGPGSPKFTKVSTSGDSEMVAGFSEAVIGQQVGSQVGVIIPPDAGFAEQSGGTVPGDDTLFYVIDILGVY